ncbi:MAG TPA: xanthine dehydrogenase family protein molybdopterin-binding subunit [Gaiellaceae bacterium]|nr:xanthine dehydrogenase family protein molybdopterin-binding subunit [Gaiellaceae bacterium]
MPRKEDLPHLTGTARFVGDVELPGMLHARIVRSPLAHARISSIGTGEALAQPGVAAVLTADDLPPATPPIPTRMFSQPGLERFLQQPLARDTVRYSGEPVAVVVAASRYVAEDAAELVELELEPLEPVLAVERALEPEAPVLHEEAGTNVAGSFVVEHGDIDAAFAAAALVVEERLAVQRHAAVPLEPRGLVANLDESGVVTVLGAAKIPHVNRRILAQLLGWPEARVRLVELHVGGGFGARGEFYPEDFLVPYCAVRLGRPVSWIEDRAEHLRACNHSREQVHELALALDGNGRFLGLRDRLLNDSGAYVRTHGLVVPGMGAALLPGPYRWPAYRCEVSHVVTCKTPAGTYRSPGRYEANFARERLIDVAAHRLGLDPVELRRRNLVPPTGMPYASGTNTDGHPVVYDSGDYPLLLEKACRRFDWDGLRRWRHERPGDGRRRGLGLAFFVEKSGIARWEYARVELSGSGAATVYSGSASMGQGVETVLAQVCADALGVAFEDVTVVHGDTASIPDGMGAFGSRAATLGGSAVHLAAESLRTRVREQGAPAPGETLSADARFESEDMTFPYGVHVAAVEVDVETGRVDIHRYGVAYDVGRALNPTLVEGQIVGGVAQGVGGALLEELVYDERGQLLSASFVDYLLPTAVEVPPVDVLITEDAPTPRNPLGAKGAGEGGAAAAGAAVANAVADALGVEVTRLPLSPERVVALAGGRT